MYCTYSNKVAQTKPYNTFQTNQQQPITLQPLLPLRLLLLATSSLPHRKRGTSQSELKVNTQEISSYQLGLKIF